MMKKREKPCENKAGSLLKDEKERKRVMQTKYTREKPTSKNGIMERPEEEYLYGK